MDLSKDVDPVVHEKMKKNLVYVSCFSIIMLFAGLTSAYIVSMGDAFWLETPIFEVLIYFIILILVE